MRRAAGLLAPVLALLCVSVPGDAQPLNCLPCVGLRTGDPQALARDLAAAPVSLSTANGDPDQRGSSLFVGWSAASTSAGDAAAALRAAGAVAAPRIVLPVPAPLTENIAGLETTLRETVALARAVGGDAVYQVVWEPSSGGWTVGDYAFLLKRAAVAITGAAPDARVMTSPLAADPDLLRELWSEEISAYIDVVALAPAAQASLRSAVAALDELDPGRPILIDAVAVHEPPERTLLDIAAAASAGAAGAFVELAEPLPPAAVTPFLVMARETTGDLAVDAGSVPAGGVAAWSFVRGDDLSLRVLVDPGPDPDDVALRFPDPLLTRPARIDLEGRVAPTPLPARRAQDALTLTVTEPGAVLLLRLDRMTAAELEGIEGLEAELTVAGQRQLPVEEILRRLQAFEDDQARRLDHYRAVNTNHLRFELSGVETFEVTFRGAYFFVQDEGFDWAWQELLINGVRWRGKKIPRIPLIQPERAASLPLEIHFTKDYRYRLRGTATVRGRDCWVVEFRPAAAVEGESLYQGTVWIDRDLYARVRTRALQVGLRGDVVSNEETVDYAPLTTGGEPAPWSRDSFYLPVHTTGQQLWSVLNATTVVETETRVEQIEINGPDFEQQRSAVLSSEATMVRETEEGLRYLVLDEETGERVVQDELQPTRIFVGGGVFYDESLDFPVPLGGVDYFSLDFRGTGTQVNAFFAGPLLTVNVADPDLFGSRWDVGADLFAIAIAGTDETFRDGRRSRGEDVEVLPARFELDLGRTLGNFGKVDLSYQLAHLNFSRADDTSEEFVIPSDHLRHRFGLTGRYNRAGWRLRAGGSYNSRSEWDAWGLPGNPDFDPDKKDYTLWGASLAKNWHLPRFQRAGIEVEYVDGSDLDRFGKYEFGFFSGVRVRGYQSDRVRAEKAWATHLSYGFEIAQIFRLSLVGDAAWATDEATALDQEFLAGAGITGNFVGPWRTIVNLDLGVALAGPDDGATLFLTFLKLWD